MYKAGSHTQLPSIAPIKGYTHSQAVLSAFTIRGAKQSQVRVLAFHVKFDRHAQAGEAGEGVTVRPVVEGTKLQLRQLPLANGREIDALHVQETAEAIFKGSEQMQAPY